MREHREPPKYHLLPAQSSHFPPKWDRFNGKFPIFPIYLLIRPSCIQARELLHATSLGAYLSIMYIGVMAAWFLFIPFLTAGYP